jgi:hypothetical protein
LPSLEIALDLIRLWNYGFADSKYILKTGYTEQADEWLDTDKQYLDNAF